MPLPVDGRVCITDPRRSARTLLLRIEMWLVRWWGAARAEGRIAEAADIWGAARVVSGVAIQQAAIHDASSAVGASLYSFR